MSLKTINSNLETAEKIKQRRKNLNLTIEEAAKKAGVGTKTWYRYESGEAIRQDKYKGVCRALNWFTFPNNDSFCEEFNVLDYKNHEAWSDFLAKCFGDVAALSFSIGSDILLDSIKEDMNELKSKSKETHIGQLDNSFLISLLPEQFVIHYDYDFLYAMYCELIHLRKLASNGLEIAARSVLDELLFVLIVKESEFLIESNSQLKIDSNWQDWIYDLFDDEDIITFLYSDIYISSNHNYHFNYWLKEQFYCK